MKQIKKILVIILLLMTASAYAIDNDTISTIKIRLKVNLPELQVSQVNPTVIPGIYEVISKRRVFYVDSSGNYAFLGSLVNLTTKQSLTEAEVKKLSAVNWQDLPLRIALRRVVGKGSRAIVVFTDPECPFCRRLEQDVLSKLTDVTIYYFLFPLSMHANADKESRQILCAENPVVAYYNWVVNSKVLPVNTKCNNANKLQQMINVGKTIVEVEATPTLVLQNGQVIKGIPPVDYLNKLINDASGYAMPDNAVESH